VRLSPTSCIALALVAFAHRIHRLCLGCQANCGCWLFSTWSLLITCLWSLLMAGASFACRVETRGIGCASGVGGPRRSEEDWVPMVGERPESRWPPATRLHVPHEDAFQGHTPQDHQALLRCLLAGYSYKPICTVTVVLHLPLDDRLPLRHVAPDRWRYLQAVWHDDIWFLIRGFCNGLPVLSGLGPGYLFAWKM
jgi:hypothetical protein